jgi:hypothetical protein
VNLGLKMHSVPKRVNCLGSIRQRIHLSISGKELCLKQTIGIWSEQHLFNILEFHKSSTS